MYDPFKRGRFSVGVRTLQLHDRKRSLRTLAETWYPTAESHFGQDYATQKLDVYTLDETGESRTQEAVRDADAAQGPHPLVIYSHGTSRWKRRSATFLCAHLASHGYVVTALDHYEVVVPRATGDDLVNNRPADVSFLIDWMLAGVTNTGDIGIEPSRICAVGYSLGGWTVLSAPESEDRIRAVVAHAPTGGLKPRPGVFDGKLSFKWKREVPAMYLFAEDDTLTPFEGEKDLFKRAPAPKKSFVLRKADHMHFLDAVEEEHEFMRTTEWPEEMAFVAEELRPASELCSGSKAQTFTAALTLAHLDASLLWKDDARRWLGENVREKLLALGIDAYGSGRSAR